MIEDFPSPEQLKKIIAEKKLPPRIRGFGFETSTYMMLLYHQIRNTIISKGEMRALARKVGANYGIILFFFPYKRQGEYIVSGFFTGENIIWEDTWWNPGLTEKDLVDSDGKPAINRWRGLRGTSEIEPTSDIKISKKTEATRISHDQMLKMATSILQEKGWQTKTKVKLPRGQADIIGWKSRESIIAEVKKSDSLNALMHAIEQLLVYKKQISAPR